MECQQPLHMRDTAGSLSPCELSMLALHSKGLQSHAALHEAPVPTLLRKGKLLADSLGRSQTQCQGRGRP